MKEYAISVSKTHIHNLNTHRYYEYYHSSHLKEGTYIRPDTK